MNAAESAPSPSNFRNRFGSTNAYLNASSTGPGPISLKTIISRARPSTRLTNVIAPITRAWATNDAGAFAGAGAAVGSGDDIAANVECRLWIVECGGSKRGALGTLRRSRWSPGAVLRHLTLDVPQSSALQTPTI